MPNIKTLQMGSSGTFNYAQGLKDGGIVSADWIQAKMMEGKAFHAYLGSASTPATFATSYVNTDPEMSVDIPSGVAIIPLRVTHVMEAYAATAALFEVITLCSKTLAAASAGTEFHPIALNNRGASGSACAVYTAPTVTNGNTTGAFELYRAVIQNVITLNTGIDTTSIDPNIFEWNYAQRGYAPVLRGESSLQTWAICGAGTGYIYIDWLEFDADDLTY